MEDSGILLGGIQIEYGKTKMLELMNGGYAVAAGSLAQILEEPYVTMCTIQKDGKPVADLAFYNIKQKISVEELADKAIDFVIVNSGKNSSITKKEAQKTKIAGTVLVHLAAILFFIAAYTIPALNGFLGSRGVFGLFLVLPGLIVLLLWGEAFAEKGNWKKKLLVLLWVLANVGFTLAYNYWLGLLFK